MRASAEFIKLFIRGLAWDAEDASTSFQSVLKTSARAKLTDTAKGKVLVGTGSGGTQVTYALPPLGDLTASDVSEVCSKLLDSVDALKAANPSITDAALVAALLAEFAPVYSSGSYFAGGGE